MTTQCTHPNYASHVFSTGEFIECCPDCDTFDAARRKTLRSKICVNCGESFEAESVHGWNSLCHICTFAGRRR